mgnify:CR=1 FL=1
MPIASLIRLLLLAALWGGSFLFMRIAAPVLGPSVTAFVRVLLGALGLYAWIRLRRIPLQFQGKWRSALLLGCINSGLPFLLFSIAAKSLPAAQSAILNATTPLIGVVVGALLFQERITWLRVAGVLLGLLGVAVLIGDGIQQPGNGAVGGIVACLAATSCYAFAGFLTVRWISRRGGLDSRLVALGSQVGAALLLLPFAAVQLVLQPIALGRVGLNVWLSILGVGLLCTSMGYVLYFRLIADEGALKALTVTFLIPLFGALWGWLALDETLGLPHLLGGMLIAAALLLVIRNSDSAAASRPDSALPKVEK